MKSSLDIIVSVSITAVLALLFVLSIGASWYRYVVHENFKVFLTEKEAPDRFDLSTY